MIQRSVTFQEQMRMSEGGSDKKDISKIILDCVPAAISVRRSNTSDDKNGTDYWVLIKSGHELSIDVKVRKDDWCKKHPNEDDIAMETWSVIGRKVGWTRDVNKRTDYILWIWLETDRWMLVPFPMLCRVFEKRWQEWRDKYKTRVQRTLNIDGLQWESECVFVPRKVMWFEIFTVFGGVSS